jgi:hypothetical protein
MDLIYITAAVLQSEPGKTPAAYRRGEALPEKPNTKIENILEADTDVVVFARSAEKPAEGITETLSQPLVSMLVSAGAAQSIQEYLQQIESPETIEEVTTIDGSVWKLDKSAPVDPIFHVVRIVRSDRGIEVVCLPNPNSEYAKSQVFVVFTLMPLTFLRVRATASLATWQQLQGELARFYEPEPDDDEEEEEEEEEEEIEAADAPMQRTAQSIVGAIPPPPGTVNAAPAPAVPTTAAAAPPAPPPPPPPPAASLPNGATTTPTTE